MSEIVSDIIIPLILGVVTGLIVIKVYDFIRVDLEARKIVKEAERSMKEIDYYANEEFYSVLEQIKMGKNEIIIGSEYIPPREYRKEEEELEEMVEIEQFKRSVEEEEVKELTEDEIRERIEAMTADERLKLANEIIEIIGKEKSVSEIVKILGISRANYYRISSGRPPKADTLLKMVINAISIEPGVKEILEKYFGRA